MSESMPRRRSRVSGDEASAARRQSKGDVGGIVTTQYAAKQSIRKLRKQTSGTSYKSISSIGSEGGDGGPAIEPLPPLEDIDDEVFEEVKKERTKSTESDMRSASGGSGGDSKSSFHEDGEEDVVGSGEEEDAQQGPDQVIKHSFKKFTTELDAGKAAAALADLQRPVTPPEKRRQNLLDKYHALLKEKRELRKRNAQAQTNICQYLRKHNIDLFPHLTELDKSQNELRDDYSDMLDRIEDLADIKDEEAKQFEKHMDEINGKKTLLQNEITRLNTEMGNVKIRTVNQPPLDKPSIHAMSQKEVVDNIKVLDKLEEEMQPVRLEYVQLKRSLDAIQMKYDNVIYEHEEDLDQTELTVENQVLSDKLLETDEELARMEHIMNNDVVVLTHVKMKHTQMEGKNTKMFMEAQSGVHKINELKEEEFKLKSMLLDLEAKFDDLKQNIGLLGNKALLKDYSNTFIDLDKAQGRVELEIPLSPASRKKKKITK